MPKLTNESRVHYSPEPAPCRTGHESATTKPNNWSVMMHDHSWLICYYCHFNNCFLCELGTAAQLQFSCTPELNFEDKWHKFLQAAGCPSYHPTNSSKHRRKLKALTQISSLPHPFFIHLWTLWSKGCCCLYVGSSVAIPYMPRVIATFLTRALHNSSKWSFIFIRVKNTDSETSHKSCHAHKLSQATTDRIWTIDTL